MFLLPPSPAPRPRPWCAARVWEWTSLPTRRLPCGPGAPHAGGVGREESCDASPHRASGASHRAPPYRKRARAGSSLAGVARPTSLETTAAMPGPRYFEGSRKM